MKNQPTLAYSIAGITVAIAIAVVASSTLGLARLTGDSGQPVTAMAIDAGAAPLRGVGGADANASGVEYVYVDPPTAGHDEDDDDDEHEDDRGHERDKSRHEREDHDDDD